MIAVILGRTSRGGSRARQRLACAAALLFVASTFANLHHFRPLSHAVCDDHGELVHVAVEGARAARQWEVGFAPGVHEADASGTIRDHEHCELAAATRHRTFTPPSVQVTPVLASTAARLADVSQTPPPPSVRGYRVAPKQSPPPRA